MTTRDEKTNLADSVPLAEFHLPVPGGNPEKTQQLLADVETPDDVEVALRIDLFQIVQQPATATDHSKQATTTCMILLVLLKVLRQPIDSSCQNGDLDLGRARIVVGPPKFRNQFRFTLFRDSHLLSRPLHLGRLGMLLRSKTPPPCLKEPFLHQRYSNVPSQPVYQLSGVLQQGVRTLKEIITNFTKIPPTTPGGKH
jgi:hypothetical protein